MPTGAAACAAETRMHRDLCRAFPDAVVPQAEFADMLNVTREIYRPALRAEIEARLDALAARIEAAPSGSAPASEESGAAVSAAESAPVSAADGALALASDAPSGG